MFVIFITLISLRTKDCVRIQDYNVWELVKTNINGKNGTASSETMAKSNRKRGATGFVALALWFLKLCIFLN